MTSNYKKDRHIIEDALIPTCIGHCLRVYAQHGEVDVSDILSDMEEFACSDMQNLSPDKRRRIQNRLIRICNVVSAHFVRHQFTAQKAVITLCYWAAALDDANAVPIDPDSVYATLLKNTLDALEESAVDEGTQKLENSARKHVVKVHALVQREGLF